MSEPIKLTEGEVEFWKACVVAVLRLGVGGPTSKADNAVVALRERTPQLMHGVDSWRECGRCHKRIVAPATLPQSHFICCGAPMHIRTHDE